MLDTSTASDAAQTERARVAELSRITTRVRLALPDCVADAMHDRAIADGWSADALRSALFQALAQSAGRPTSTMLDRAPIEPVVPSTRTIRPP